jgi:putative ABC transport system ATP-binding protein
MPPHSGKREKGKGKNGVSGVGCRVSETPTNAQHPTPNAEEGRGGERLTPNTQHPIPDTGIRHPTPDTRHPNTAEPPPLIRLENVDKTYLLGQIEVRALRGVTFSLPPGEFVVLVGPSGSGKTTLLNIIGGLDQATSGQVEVAGNDLLTMNESALTRYRRDVVGFIFQFFNLVPTLTARENVELVAELADKPLNVEEALRAVGLGERMNHFPAALSGGEQQRVAIARALVKRPALILADEPTGNLDYETGVLVLQFMHRATHELGASVLLVTHNNEITHMADRVVSMHSGQINEVRVNPNPIPPDQLRW